ncbi:hypothetical protein DUNSADRAFT_16068 [Dunaliella salina]|uniref:Plastid division regulator MinE n=1 Tax=Dunaliella salina TaxID=3046 RepID=A0ABQ7G4F0_DUNSA|nr:hypothetical protein DUNSADRAFT_16068 [Dunaliella salina]|eukprot:KAF5829444.1 hypothetical protein DUNSADRAFT_16068 [Dunaliella salina]
MDLMSSHSLRRASSSMASSTATSTTWNPCSAYRPLSMPQQEGRRVCVAASQRGSNSSGNRSLQVQQRAPNRDVSDGDAAVLKSMVASQFQYQVRKNRKNAEPKNPVSDFVHKLNVAWRIFFPEQPKQLSAKEEVKKRLRMVLVADRCGMSPASLSEMKNTIIKALQDYVDIEGEEGIEVSISTEPGLGTVYSVNIPIRRVKAETRFAEDMGDAEHDGVTLEWDPMDRDANPSSRFPQGC